MGPATGPFLGASSHLYMRVCPSIGPLVHPSVRPSVTLSLKTGKLMILIANNDVSCNHIISTEVRQLVTAERHVLSKCTNFGYFYH